MKNNSSINNDYKENFSINESLSRYSWFNLGGPAEILFKPDNINQISSFLKNNKEKLNILGAGSNTLIRDKGVKGVTLKLSPKFSYIEWLEKDVIKVGAATLDKKLSEFGVKNSIQGFEFLSCIPGSIGGGIKMNCGCYGENISDNLLSVEVIDMEGNIKHINKNQIRFSYRNCDLPEEFLILSVKFKAKKGNSKTIQNKKIDLLDRKKKSQPQRVKTCGSTFKNSEKDKAWELIKKSDCEKLSVGDAIISDKHCNFFINNGNAKTHQIEELILKVRETVYQKTGIKLDLEIKIIGEKW